MNGQAASALLNISPAAWTLYGIAGLLAAGLLGWGLILAVLWWRDVAVIAVQLARAYVRRRKLIAAISAIDGATRPMDLGDLVIHPEQERHAAWQAGRLSETSADLPAVRCHRHRTGSTAWPCTCETNPGGDL